MKHLLKVTAPLAVRFIRRGGCAILLLGICLVAAKNADAPSGNNADAKEKLHVYLLIGGSAIEGVAKLPGNETEILERCYLLDADGKWEPARVPLNRHSSIKDADRAPLLGPGISFAKAMLEQDPDIAIGLVVNAGADTKIEDWGFKSRNYREARRRTRKQALQTGTLKGVLWHHDSSHSISVLDDMKDLVAELRSSFGIWSLPFVAGETPRSPSMNSQLAALNSEVHATGIASAKGLRLTEQGKFDAAAITTLGERYAAEMQRVHAELATREAARPKRQPSFIDTHVHAFANREGGLDPVAEWMKKANVERCIVSPIGQSRAKTPGERELMLANFRKHKGRIDRFCIIEPDEVDSVQEAVDILKKEIANGAIGFGEHYGRDLMFDDPKNMRLYAACELVGLPVMFHIDQNKNMDERGLLRVERVLKAFPECVIIAHAYWWLHLPDGTCDRLLQSYPNLYADVSGLRVAGVLNRDRNYSRDFLIRNADKILFGSDAGWWSFGDRSGEEAQFRLFEELDLPEDVRTRIYRTNAKTLFGFQDAEPGRAPER